MNDAVRVVLPQLPFVIMAYGLLWAVLFGFIVWVYTRVTRVEKEVAVIEASVRRRDKLEAAEAAERAQ
jgi:heme exporter protein CcmD